MSAFETSRQAQSKNINSWCAQPYLSLLPGCWQFNPREQAEFWNSLVDTRTDQCTVCRRSIHWDLLTVMRLSYPEGGRLAILQAWFALYDSISSDHLYFPGDSSYGFTSISKDISTSSPKHSTADAAKQLSFLLDHGSLRDGYGVTWGCVEAVRVLCRVCNMDSKTRTWRWISASPTTWAENLFILRNDLSRSVPLLVSAESNHSPRQQFWTCFASRLGRSQLHKYLEGL